MTNVLVAGASGYLGKHVVENLISNGFNTTAIVRNTSKLSRFNKNDLRIIEAEPTQSSAINGCCHNIDVVISCLGITKQKDGMSYMDVDYQANLNLLHEAKFSGVKKFIYVSVLHGESLTHLEICKAKEKFVEALAMSGLEYCVIRPSGFFSDLAEIYNMAKNGRVYLFDKGQYLSNPIHGEDLAHVCVSSINSLDTKIEVGGPETLSQVQIAELAFEALNKKPNILYIPNWCRRLMFSCCRLLLTQKQFGPIAFFLTVMAIDMSAPNHGDKTLLSYYKGLNNT